MSESSAGEVVESLGATCTIPRATTISSDLLAVRRCWQRSQGASTRSVVLEERHFLG
jgi:hypothetical protein